MGLNDNTKGLIRSVADNDMQRAKAYVKAIIANETAASNQGFVRGIKAKLETPAANMMELPNDIKHLIKMEDVSVSFNEQRYYFTVQESAIYENIRMANEVNRQLAEMGLRYLNSTLLHGESGTGKTTFGRFVAYKLGVPFVYLNFSHLIGSYLGETGKNIMKVFEYAAKLKCVLMLDEVDALGIRRGEGNEVGEMSRVVIGLMQALDLLENDIIVLAATNRIDVIDEALKRRFTIQHEIKPLNSDGTLNMVKRILDDLQIEYDEESLRQYAQNHGKQSEIANDLTTAIIRQIQNGGKVSMAGNRLQLTNRLK